MALIRLIFWIALFLVSTFAFTVLFEHGVTDFSANAQKELDSLKKMYAEKSDQKKADATSIGR
jgi:hypothetical protein